MTPWRMVGFLMAVCLAGIVFGLGFSVGTIHEDTGCYKMSNIAGGIIKSEQVDCE